METVAIIMGKIMKLANDRQQPFIILENPQLQTHPNLSRRLVATVGNVSVKFEGFSVDDMVEVYAGLKALLAIEEAKDGGYEPRIESAKST